MNSGPLGRERPPWAVRLSVFGVAERMLGSGRSVGCPPSRLKAFCDSSQSLAARSPTQGSICTRRSPVRRAAITQPVAYGRLPAHGTRRGIRWITADSAIAAMILSWPPQFERR